MKQMILRAVGEVSGAEGAVLALSEMDGNRILMLGIGVAEASSIAWAVEGVSVPRPMTHDLMAHVISRLGGSLKRVLIHEVHGETVVGQLDIETDVGVVEVDARPSDCVALAVRENVPIYASEVVLASAAVSDDALETENEQGDAGSRG